MFGFGRKAVAKPAPEARGAVIAAASEFFEFMGLPPARAVTLDQALGVPAVWSAVNFLAGTVAGLPLFVYDKKPDGKSRVRATGVNPIVSVLHDAVNEGLTSYQWRFNMMVRVLTEGRALTYIERDAAGRVINLFPIIDFTVARDMNGRVTYTTTSGGRSRVYAASEVIDIPFMLKSDGLTHRSPLRSCGTALAKAVAANDFGARFFDNGGMPPYALTGPFQSGEAARRASDDVSRAASTAAKEGRNVVAIPGGHELKPLGSNPVDMQLIEVMNFAVTEVARLYQLPPNFVQDLSRATFSNVEQQDLHLVKHTLRRWLEQIEAELNLKLFGRNPTRIAEFNLDGLMRGDFRSRIEAFAQAVQTGQMTPDECRALENRPPIAGGDRSFIQGANVPLEMAGQHLPGALGATAQDQARIDE